MQIGLLLSELENHEPFGTYAELMEWVVKWVEEYTRAPSSQDRTIIKLLKAINQKVKFNCDFGDKQHSRDDECWYCHKSICTIHIAKRILYSGAVERKNNTNFENCIFFSVCTDCLPKMDMQDLGLAAKNLLSDPSAKPLGKEEDDTKSF